MTKPGVAAAKEQTAGGKRAVKDEEESAAPWPPNYSEAMVTFLIVDGETTTKLMVHKEFVCYHSPVFNAAFNSSFIEGQTQTYRLEDTKVSVFRDFLQWVYGQSITSSESLPIGQIESWIERGEPCTEEMQALIELWILADRLVVHKLQNAILNKMDGLMAKSDRGFPKCYKYVYNNTSEERKLRKYFNDRAVACCREKDSKLYPPAMLVDISPILMRIIREKEDTIQILKENVDTTRNGYCDSDFGDSNEQLPVDNFYVHA